MSLGYTELATRSLKHAWNHKFLWLFGFFVGGESFLGMFSWIRSSGSWSGLTRLIRVDLESILGLKGVLPFGTGFETILTLLAGAFLLWLFFAIMSFLSEGALINGVYRKQSGVSTTFGECWSRGIDTFWRVLVILIVLGFAVAAAILFIAFMLIPMYLISVALGVVLTIMIGFPAFLVLLFLVEATSAWSLRFAVIDNASCFDAIGKGWKMLQANIGKSFGVGLTSTIVQIVFGIFFTVVTLIVALPFIAIAIESLIAGIVLAAPLLLAAAAIASAYLGLFKSSIWTIAYMQITGKTASVAPAAADTGTSLPDEPGETWSV